MSKILVTQRMEGEEIINIYKKPNGEYFRKVLSGYECLANKEKTLVVQYHWNNLGIISGERIYKLTDGNYLRERWDEFITDWIPCSPQRFEEIFEIRRNK